MGLALNYTENREGSITTSAPTGANTAECPARGGGGGAPVTRRTAAPAASRRASSRSLADLAEHLESVGADTATNPLQGLPRLRSGRTGVCLAARRDAASARAGARGGVPSGRATLQATEPITEQDITGQTTLKLELQFTRLLVVDAMGLPADARSR